MLGLLLTDAGMAYKEGKGGKVCRGRESAPVGRNIADRMAAQADARNRDRPIRRASSGWGRTPAPSG